MCITLCVYNKVYNAVYIVCLNRCVCINIVNNAVCSVTPMMQCVQSTVHAMVNQAQAYITCNVTAPVTTKPDFYFSFPPRNLSLHIGDTLQKSPDGTYTADVTFVSDIDNVTKFGHSAKYSRNKLQRIFVSWYDVCCDVSME